MVGEQFASVLRDYPSDMTLESLEHDVLRGMQLLWIGWDGFKIVAAGTTELIQTPAHKICSITAAFGVNTRLWDKFIPMVDEYARNEGCSRLRVAGREGWKRVLKGFEEPWIVLERKLD